MMKFIAVAGSVADKSYNRTLLEFMQKHFANKVEIEILDLREVPMFVETEDQDNLPIIQTFNKKIAAADGVILATPEHNHSVPSALKSLIEHLSFNLHPLDGKPVMLVGALWRRGHKPEGHEGFAFISVLKPYVEENGGLILTETPAKELLVEEEKITGAIARNANGDKVIIHAKAAIITSGGFGANTKMLQKYNTYWTEIADDIKTSNSRAITGDGILLGEAVGAELVGMGFSQLMPTSDPDTGALFSGLQVPPANFVMVDTNGKRFVNEVGSRDELAQVAINVGGFFYLIADDKIKETAYNTNQEKLDQQVAVGTLFRDDTIEGLASQIGIDPAVLADTVAKYNSYVDAGEDPEFHKSAFDLKVVEAPFYATPRKPAVHHTMGGLKIDPETRVINSDGQVIPGLFAAGEVAGGIHAGNRLGGNALADIFTFGRIAAITAIAEID